MTRGRVVFVGAGPGDPELLTLRGWRALQAADVVCYDSLVDERILEDVRAERLYVGKRCGRHSMRQEQLTELLAELALAGRRVVRLKGGDPSVLGRVGEEALRLAELGIPFEIVPGVTSAVAAPAFAGIPVTHRGLADSFCVVSAHRRGDDLDLTIPPYHERTTLVLLMAAQTLDTWLPLLRLKGYPADLPVAFIVAATTSEQRVVTTTVARAAAAAHTAGLGSPTMAVVGRVVELRATLRWFAEAGDPPALARGRTA
jgi:uroporphyrinogen III methyltransferase/synthase